MDRDYAFEALADVTGTDWNTGRGIINAALKSIKEQTEIEDSYLLADLIHDRAKMYREAMPEVILTPPALAKHWRRVLEESERKKKVVSTNRSATSRDCPTCGGDKFVLVRLRPQKATAWMLEHGIEPSKTEMHEEYAPCPEPGCGTPVEYTQFDGRRFRSMDPAAVREALNEMP